MIVKFTMINVVQAAVTRAQPQHGARIARRAPRARSTQKPSKH